MSVAFSISCEYQSTEYIETKESKSLKSTFNKHSNYVKLVFSLNWFKVNEYVDYRWVHLTLLSDLDIDMYRHSNIERLLEI